MQVNGWELFAHPLLLDQLKKLMAAVEKAKAKAKKRDDYKSTAKFKLLADLYELMLVTIPADPARPDVWEGANAACVAKALGAPLTASARASRTEWRDRRLLALRSHKRKQTASD